MRKTILIGALALLLSATTAVAADRTRSTTFAVENVNISNVAISSFCKAIMNGDVEAVKKLIELGEDVNQKSLGMAPVHFAARYNKAEILEVLIDNGADLNVRCNKGWSVEKYAKLSNATEVLTVLKNHV